MAKIHVAVVIFGNMRSANHYVSEVELLFYISSKVVGVIARLYSSNGGSVRPEST